MSFQYSENRFFLVLIGLIRKSEVSLVISEKNCAKSKFFYSDKNICCQVVFFNNTGPSYLHVSITELQN